MSKRLFQRVLIALIMTLFLLGSSLYSQSGVAAIDKARGQYAAGDFQAAFDTVAQAIPETSKDQALKNQAGNFLTEMGVSEYAIRNFKNAYECFKKALKYSPTNSTATNYYLKMKKEMDVNALKNEGDIAKKAAEADAAVKKAAEDAAIAKKAAEDAAVSKKAAEEAAIAKKAAEEAAAKATPSAQAAEFATAVASPTVPPVSNAEVVGLINKLSDAQDRLSTVQASASSAKSENDALKAQLDSQRALVKETLSVLARISEKSAAATPQVIVQSDPGVQALASSVADQRRLLESKAQTDTLIIIVISAVGVILLGLVLFFVLGFLRAKRKRNADQMREPFQYSPSVALPSSSSLPATAQRPLLEFVDQKGGELQVGGDVDLRKQLLKAERISRMYEEVKTGSLSWDTVRNYTDEMETSLKADILALVETKLAEGDLVSNDAVLPILFPFLTDYDDYIRDKAEKAAATALIEDTRSKNDPADGPFGLRTLMNIPEGLKAVLKGRDQSLITAKLSRSIAKSMGMSVADCKLIYKAALAHDAGYLMLDENELQKIIGKSDITEDEFDFIRSHVAKGPEYFKGTKLPAEISGVLLCHHERNDGSGYPNGLKRDEIPIFARIVGTAESFAALLSSRPHRDKMEQGYALAIIRDARLKFDREIVDALGKVVQSSGSYK